MGGTVAAYRRLLGNGPLTRLLAGEFISSIGDWLYLVALLIVIDEQTGDAVLLGIVGGLRILPYVVLSIPAGIAADRFDRRRILIVTDLARGALMLAIAAVVATGGHWLILVALTTTSTCFSAFFGPTIGAYLPSLARDERELGPANSLWSTLDNVAFIVGPALAFLLIAGLDLTLAFLLNAISFAICAAFLWGLPAGRPGTPATMATDEADAIPDRDDLPTPRPPLRPLIGLTLIGTVAAFVFGGIGIMTVILAGDVYAAGSEATGLLNAAIGVGGLLGAILSGALIIRRSLGAPFIGGVVALAVGVIALGLVDSLGAALVAMALLAAGDLIVEVVDTTLFQRIVPDAMRGRALGAIDTIVTLAMAAGSFAIPVAALALGPAPVLIGCGAAIVIAGLGAFVLIGRAAIAEPAPLPVPVRRVASLPVFAGMPAARLDDILGRLTPIAVAAGDVVIREGDDPDRFYVIDRGSYTVTQSDGAGGQRELRAMGPDEVFGEIGLLTGGPRTATVTATTDGRLLALDAADFAALVSVGPGLSNRLLDLHRGAVAVSPA